MENQKTNKLKTIKIIALLSYLAMIIVNILANTLPINGITTGELSEKYMNLFNPADYVFSIWGAIYFLLAVFLIYEFNVLKKFEMAPSLDEKALYNVNFYFILTSLANALWVFAWHYEYILLSTILVIIILVNLILIALQLRKTEKSFYDKLFIKLPFSFYFGWMTIATISAITTLLVSVGWNGFGLSDQFWTIAVIIIGLIIGGLMTLYFRDLAYGAVLFWAYLGILVKHLSQAGFDGQYTGVIITTIISLVIILAIFIYLLILKIKKYRK